MSWSACKKSISCLTVLSLFVAMLFGAIVPAAEAASESDNLALNRPSTTSQGNSGAAVVDGDPATYWQPSMSDREDLNAWLQVDLGTGAAFNSIVYDMSRITMSKLDVLYSDDGIEWQTAASRTASIQPYETIRFDTVNARYIKFDMTLNNGLSYQFREFAVYLEEEGEEIPADLESIYFVDGSGTPYSANAELVVELGEEAQLKLMGRTSSNIEVGMDTLAKSYTSTATGVAGIGRDGIASGYKVGAARVYAEVEKPGGGKLRTPDFWIKVVDPNEFRLPSLIADTELIHEDMTMEIGQPAVLEPGDPLPSVRVEPMVAATVSGVLSRNGEPGDVVLPEQSFEAFESRVISLGGQAEAKGEYALTLRIEPEGTSGRAYNDTYYFTIMDPSDVPEGGSKVAYLDPSSGKMVYVPDYRGNRIIDFSQSGYGGGGVPLPDVQARVVVEPGEGDDTARIQDAIDRVALMPVRSDGFRGAVLLKKGNYEIAGKLSISTGGIVLRGEGDGEDGTVLRATGTTKRNIIEAKGGSGPVLDSSTRQEIVDLYVPSGASVIEVADASSYNVGDTVIVRRYGNERWIHEIGMDYIYMRPGTDGSATSQWTPFNLDFDRVVTAIDGNVVTLDAPIANAIERRWGGGELYRYSDDSRIERIGVERMRVVSDFDPSVIDTVMDNDTTDPYYADENHAERFVVLDNIKNAWVRDVTGYHLSYSLVQMGRGSKWITVQDSSMYDMVSIITGGRRYIFHMMGQQTLVQRVYTETARHAFVVDSRIQGPNVVLDSESQLDYNTSEPHHKWSVGGLFDNVDAQVSIRDRAWLGSGHGWSGANYVNWNTEGGLTSQQPPTAQNYVIGHVGTKVPPLVPSAYDPRPRKDAYWESAGQHIAAPVSLYKQQLLERLGQEAVDALAPVAYGGGDKDVPPSVEGEPLLTGISLDGVPLSDFIPETYSYTVKLPLGAGAAPTVSATAREGLVITIEQADSLQGAARITVYETGDSGNSLQYEVKFESMPVLGSVPRNLTVYPIVSAEALGSHASYPPSNAIDGDLGTRWAGSGRDQWIVFDLGREHSVSYVLTARFDESHYDYDIELSKDGAEWTKVFTGMTSGTPNMLEPVQFPAADARFVRLVTRGSDKDAWNNLNEIVIAGVVPQIEPGGIGYMPPANPVKAQDTVTAARNGKAVVMAFDAAKLQTYLKGAGSQAEELIIRADGDADAEEYKLLIRAEALAALADAASDELRVGFETAFGKIVLRTEELLKLAGAGKVDLTLQIRAATPEEAAAIAAAHPQGELVSELVAFQLWADGGKGPETAMLADAGFVELELPLNERFASRDRTAIMRLDVGAERLTAIPAVFGEDGTKKAAIRCLIGCSGVFAAFGNSSAFDDTVGHWAEDVMVKLADKRIMNGASARQALPDAPIGRAELAALLVRGLGLPAGESKAPFADVTKGDWHADIAAAAGRFGLIQGYGDGTFRPDQPINRMELAVLIYRSVRLAETATGWEARRVNQDAVPPFVDDAEIEPWAREAVDGLRAMGLLEGRGGNRFVPRGQATRAEAAALIARMLESANLMN
jgi:hypothetical protein